MSGDVEDLETANGWPADGVPAERIPVPVPAEVVTPGDRALDVELALFPVRRWRRVSPHKPALSCPLCGSSVADDHRAIGSHVEDHKRRELAAAAAGLPPGHEVLTVDYASVAERATRHAHIAVAAALGLMLAVAVLIVVLAL